MMSPRPIDIAEAAASRAHKAAAEPFDAAEGMITSHLPWAIDRAHTPVQVEGQARTRELGDLRLVTSSVTASQYNRRKREVNMTEGEYIAFVLNSRGTEVLTQDGRQEVTPLGGVIAWDSVRSAECLVRDHVAKHVLFMPRARFQSAIPRPELITMQPLPPSPATRMLSTMLDQASQDDGLTSATAAAVGSAAFELTRAACMQQIPIPASWDDSALLMFSQRYIDDHLPDPMLDPNRLARAMGVSRRRLYEVFALVDETVAAYIKRMRLDRAHQELVQWPPSKHIAEIAREVGFTDAAHFTRSFRAAFGEAPRDVRRRLGPL